MSSSFDYLDLCRLCLVKDRVTVPIFEAEGDVRQIFLKITACLPVKVSRDDKLPKKICDDCVYKVETFYQFWNTTANAEKQLLQWLCEVGGLEDKQGYEVLDSNVMKQEQGTDSRLDGNVMQVGGHQNNMDMGMMDNMSLITMSTGSEQQFTSVPMDASGTVQAVPGPSTQTHEVAQSQTGVSHIVEEEEESEEDENSDEGCDNEEGLPVKEETEEGQSDQTLEPTQFVSLPCDEAGPSGLQQQKMAEMSEMTMQQTADGDPKTGIEPEELPSIYLEIKDNVYDSTKVEIRNDEDQEAIEEEEEEEEDEIKDSLDMQDYEQYEELDDDDNDDDEDKATTKTTDTVQYVNADDDNVVTEQGEIVESEMTNHQPTDDSTTEPIRSLLVRMDSGIVKRLFQCSQCDMFFASAKQCVRHMSTGHPKSRKYRVAYRCKTCQKLFRTKYGCENHIQGKHKHRTFECRYCEFKTASMAYIKKHERNHVDDYEIRCDLCNKGFASKAVLERHMISHTGEKPFTCNECNASYADKRSLQLHATVHDPAGRPKKYTCEICEYSSFWKNAVKTHMKIHTGAKVICDECGQAVASNYYLKIHKRIHSDEKPFTCDVCSKGFRQMKNLVVHQRTHTKVKPYKCNDCGKSFSQNVWLRKHKCNPA